MTFNIAAVVSTNFIALLLSLTMAMDGVWKRHKGDTERELLSFMFAISSGACVLDTISCLADGRAGAGWLFVNFIANSLVYLSGIGGIWCWCLLMEHHLFGAVSRKFSRATTILFCICIGLVILNIFVPVVFLIDENNIYHRRFGLYIVAAVELLFFAHSLARYFIAKKRGGMLKFFPVINFMIPVIFGLIVQMADFGTSFIPACCVIATTSIAVSFQNEAIYRDKLTGLYNRAYLDFITSKLTRESAPPMTGVMLDVNGFKGINDNFGHQTGDEALITISRILEKSVKEYGTVIRYAGDEFILLINSTDNTIANICFDRMKDLCSAFNAASHTYELSLSYGYEIFYPADDSLDDFMNRIDKKMYADKQRYYEETGKDRRTH